MKVSIVIPTRNESLNIRWLLVDLIPNYDEVLVVDDSDDDTAEIAATLGARVIGGDRKGLGQAILKGIYAAKSEVIVVMDADLSHNPKYIPDLLKPILEQGYDMTIGSRYVKNGGIEGWTPKRILISRVASMMAYPVSWIKDNTSGFFAIRTSLLDNVKLNADSWKIMLEILIKARPDAVMEVPIIFTDRTQGESKFNRKEVKNYLYHLGKLAWYKYKAIFKFGLIGGSGALLHFLLLYTFTSVFNVWYLLSAVLSIVVASTSNYMLNHRFTFSERQISNHIIGWFKYQVMSGITDLMYLGLLALFVELFGFWYMAGAFVAVILIFPVKFVVASTLIWSKKLNPQQADYEWIAFYRGSLIQKWWKHQIAKTVWEWIPNASNLLDIGCGSSPIISKYGANATGLDVNTDKIALMKEKLPQVNYINGGIARAHGEYDHIICIEVLEHLVNADGLIKQVSEKLKTGGQVVFATPDYSRPLWHIAEMFTPYKEEHVTRFNRELLEQTCHKYGLKPVRYRYVATCDLIEMFVKA